MDNGMYTGYYYPEYYSGLKKHCPPRAETGGSYLVIVDGTEYETVATYKNDYACYLLKDLYDNGDIDFYIVSSDDYGRYWEIFSDTQTSHTVVVTRMW